MTTNTLNGKERAVVAVGASVASGCQPCTEHHVKAAAEAGACERGVRLAVETALAVRQDATAGMDHWAQRCQGGKPEIDAEFRGSRQLLVELVSVTAAVCVNSVAGLTLHAAAARELGATDSQIRSAIAIATAIRRIAEEKLAAAIGSVVGDGEPAAAASGCCGAAPAAPRSSEQERRSCGCN